MHILFPDQAGKKERYELSGKTIATQSLTANPVRTVFAAAHVTINPLSTGDPSNTQEIDWAATMAFRHHLHGLGLGIAEAMDTAQRGMGLNYAGALELIRRTKEELPDALVFNGAGTDQLNPQQSTSLEQVLAAYLQQVHDIQAVDGRLIIMASRALSAIAQTPDDYITTYSKVLAECNQPVILHWLGDMFDPALAGYWGSHDFPSAMHTVLEIIEQHADKIDGIKVSLLDKQKEIDMRRLLPTGVKMYTGDDFNYPELIAGDEQGYSHALLGIFDPLAPLAASAIVQFEQGDKEGFHALLDPSVAMAREIFRAPTRFYKTGVVFLAWLNDFQEHFIMLGGAQSMRPLPHFVTLFKQADQLGLLRYPELAMHRMKKLLDLYGCS